MPYRVYVIQNREGKYYIGLSDDVSRRISQHNFGDSRWTRGKGPWILIWTAGSNPAPATKSRRMPATYRVYILQNCEGGFYVGLSDDVAHRVEQHNTGHSRWTKGRGPWTVVWQSEELSLTDARKLENRLKRQGRGKGFYTITGLHRSGS